MEIKNIGIIGINGGMGSLYANKFAEKGYNVIGYDTSFENKLFKNDTDIAKMIVKVPRIRLRPELELYNLYRLPKQGIQDGFLK